MELKGYIWAKQCSPAYRPGGIDYYFFEGSGESKHLEENGYVAAFPHTITFEPVDPKALIEGQVVCLLRRKDKLNTEHTQAIREIDDAIANLRCLEMSSAASE